MRLVRLLGILAAQLLLVAGIHQIYFGSIVHNYSLYSLSSTFFAVGAIVFFPTFALRWVETWFASRNPHKVFYG